MGDFYTVKQVQDLLKVDRITIYRMLQDGRLKGIKIGHQWRFNQSEVERILGVEKETSFTETDSANGLPIHCIQTIQNLFSDISQMTSLVVDMLGNPLTNISHPCTFCAKVMASSNGREACKNSWRAMAAKCQKSTDLFNCHAGLQYAAAPIMDQGIQIGAFLTGEFYSQAPDRYEESDRVNKLSNLINLPASELNSEIHSVPVISIEKRNQIESWPRTAAQAVHSILEERTGFIARLQKIADLTHIV